MNENDDKNENLVGNKNNNGLNNNHEDFKMDIKPNTENDPLTGSKILSTSRSTRIQRFRQRVATPNTFMAVFLLAFVFQGTYFTYFVSVMTTIEKVFHISSAWIAIILNFSEIGQICTSLVLAYYAGRGHRPRFIAIGTMMFSIAAFMSLTPHFIFYSSLYKTDLTTVDNSPLSTNANTNSTIVEISNQCLDENKYKNLSSFDSTCMKTLQNSQPLVNTQIQTTVLVIFSVSLLFIGIGQTAITTLGIPYIDDNVKAAQSSLYIAITIGVRILGPLLGYYLGSYCTTKFVDLSQDVDTSDSNFIGAWWLGIVIVSACMFLSSVIMFIFPKTLRNKMTQVTPVDAAAVDKCEDNELTDKIEENEKSQKLDEENMENSSEEENFIATIKRHITNKVFMLRTISAVLHLLPITGLYIFLPRYLETQFLIPTNRATFFSGTFGILTMGLGISITGVISAKYQLTAKQFARWVVISAFLTALGLFLLMLVGCSMDNYKGLSSNADDPLIFKNNRKFSPICSAYNSTCYCDDQEYNPLCGSDGNIYFSACHAGCKSKSFINKTEIYSQCECLPDADDNFTASTKICNTGRCDSHFYIFIAIFAFTVFIHSSSEVGRMVIIMRCVPSKDKTMAMGIVQFSLGVFANIPCPNIYAGIVNASCIVWHKLCGQSGYCSLYDSDTFRINFFGFSCILMIFAFITDMLILKDAESIEYNNHHHEGAKMEKNQENLLKTRKMSEDISADEIPMK